MKQEIAQRILDEFTRTGARVGYCIPERWILHTLRPSLNPKEQMEIDPAIEHLREKGILEVERRSGMLALVLTETGYEALYDDDSAASLGKIRQQVLDGFARTNSRVGHCLDEKWLLHHLIPTLNPKERDLLDPAIRAMADEGLIELGKRMSMTALALTQKGFDAIY